MLWQSTSDYHCNHFACTDPEADCVDDDDFILFEGCRNVEAIGEINVVAPQSVWGSSRRDE